MSSSYDQLLKQVEALRTENTNLRRELRDNSSHLTQLENDATCMKDVLSHLKTSFGDDLNQTFQNEAPYSLGDLTSDMVLLDQNSNHDDSSSGSSDLPIIPPRPVGHRVQTTQGQGQDLPDRGQTEGSVSSHSSEEVRGVGSVKSLNSGSPCGEAPSKRHSGDKELYTALQELDSQRTNVLHEVEEEEKIRQWYCEQIEALDRKIETLPLTEPYNSQGDMARRQLEYEAQRIRSSMKKELGTKDQMASRHKARLHRIQMVESEMRQLHQHYREQRKQDENPGMIDETMLDGSTSTHEFGNMLGMIANGGMQNGGQDDTNLAAIYHGAWPMPHGGPTGRDGSLGGYVNQDTASVMSFNSSHASSGARKITNQQLGTKVEMVYSLLSMLGTHDKDDMSRTLLAMSSSQDSCIAMRQSGCMPLLIQLLHGSDKESGLLGNTRGSKAARERAAAALHNVVHSHPDDKRGRREARVLRLLEQIRAHCDKMRDTLDDGQSQRSKGHLVDMDHHPGPTIAALMKLSFDEEHRHAICTLGGLQAIAELLQVDTETLGNTRDQYTITMRRYSCMALTNLTFGDGTNKALLCSMKAALQALVNQLDSSNEDLAQVAASVLRNLSWRADLASKKALREVNTVTLLMKSARRVKKESTLKSILSALWNLSAHCSENKADICAVEGSLSFLVGTLTYKSPSKTLSIIENGGGILRNISSHIAVREDYRRVLRKSGCLQLLLKHLRSPSLTIVSNACGTLWNISARCQDDQQALWDMGAVGMLKNLVHSKHKMISMGSAAALKNLLAAKPTMRLNGEKKVNPAAPTLQIRKQRALESELDQNLAETCDNIESPQGSPTEKRKRRQCNGPKYLFSRDNGGLDNGDDGRLLSAYKQAKANSVDSSPLAEKKQHLHRDHRNRHLSRSSSQDSLNSVQSDLPHTRSRGRSGDGASKSGGSSKSSDTASDKAEPNSRIMQMLEEVASSAGVTKDGPEGQQQSQLAFLTQMEQLISANMGQLNMLSQGQTNNAPMSEWARMAIETYRKMPHNAMNLNTVQEPNPNTNYSSLNYLKSQSIKAQQLTEGNVSSQQQQTMSPSKYGGMSYNAYGQQSDFTSRIPLVGGYSGSPYASRRHDALHNATNAPSIPSHAFEPHQQQHMSRLPQRSYPPATGLRSASMPGYQPQYIEKGNANMAPMVPGMPSTYAEPDMDSDQPTNFSLRYSDDTEQAVNFGSRYPEREGNSGEFPFRQPGLSNQYMDTIDTMDSDQVKTFCTEGTPLNYLSTATSMDDLTSAAKEANAKSKDSPPDDAEDEPQNYSTKYSESEHLSGSGSNSTERRTTSTVVESSSGTAAPSSGQNNQNHNGGTLGMQTYDDTNNPHSPRENPKEFFVEGTPLCFSRVSSLSSLNSNDARDQRDFESHNPPLKSIQENEEQHRGDNQQTTSQLNRSSQSAHNKTTSGSVRTATPASEKDANKSVSFDDHGNTVQDTPLMFSRCSSLGSLSSFDAHSVHSSVLSEYSRRASEVVSPSELPDSPSDTMPPTRSESPAVNNKEVSDSERKYTKNSGVPLRPRLQPSVPPVIEEKEEGFQESPVYYADEDTPTNFSCSSSLSALTIDDEPKIEKEADMRSKRQIKEDDKKTQNKLIVKKVIVQSIPEESESSSMSENEQEDMLQQCINFGMPASVSRKKVRVRKSSSDNSIKNRTESNQKPKSGASVPGQKTGIPKSSTVPGGIANSVLHGDVMKTYATEGTPLNFSAATSLSDLSVTSHSIDNQAQKGQQRGKNIKSTGQEGNNPGNEDDSDASSTDEGDDLLSEVIQSAMPKKVKPTKRETIDRIAEGCEDKHRSRLNAAAVIKAPRVFQPQRTSSHISASRPVLTSDTVRCYKTEDTPVHLSTATSLSDLTIDDYENPSTKAGSKNSEANNNNSSILTGNRATYGSATTRDDSVFYRTGSFDSPTVFGVEDTPVSFSRNDSLSSLSCDDASDIGVSRQEVRAKHGLKQVRVGHGRSTLPVKVGSPNRGKSPGTKSHLPMPLNHQRSNRPITPGQDVSKNVIPHAQVPASNYRKSPLKAIVENRGNNQRKNAASPAVTAQSQTQQHLRVPQSAEQSARRERKMSEDSTIHYAVEGTPMCFSRASPLSSIDVSEDEAEKPNKTQPNALMDPPTEQQTHYTVEDTPACFSRNSSLSSLSVDSSSYDPTSSEQALLDECITSAMPLNPKRTAKASKSRLPRSSPNGCSGNVSPDKRSQKANHVQPLQKVNENPPTVAPSESPRVIAPKSRVKTTQEPDRKTQVVIGQPVGAGNANKFGWSSRRAHSDETQNTDKRKKEVSNMQRSLTGSLEASPESFNTISEEDNANNGHLESLDGRQTDSLNLSDSGHEKQDDQKTSPSDCSERSYNQTAVDATFIDEADDSVEHPVLQEHIVYESTVPLNLDGPKKDQHGAIVEEEDFEAKITSEMDALEINDDTMEIDADDICGEEGSLCEDLLFDDEDEERQESDECGTPENNPARSDNGISPEEELMLQESANIIVSEISERRNLAESTTDDELFIENETISLISGEDSSSSDLLSGAICARSARICKPGSEESSLHSNSTLEEDTPKAVRGKRKPLYSGKPIAVTKSPVAVTESKGKPGAKQTPAKTGLLKPGGQAVKKNKTPSSSPATRTVSGQSPGRRTASQSPGPRGGGRGREVTQASSNEGSPRMSRKSASQDSKQDSHSGRTTPIDSATYTKKKSPSKDEASPKKHERVNLRNRSSSSNDSGSPPQRTSWENALGTFNFVVDDQKKPVTPQKNDGRATPQKNDGRAGLKPDSDGCRRGSKGSLASKNGKGSSGSLSGSKGNLTKAVTSRPSTPTGRKTPPSGRRTPIKADNAESTTPKKAGIIGKKQISSKIAGIWKKTEAEDRDQSPSPPSSTTKTTSVNKKKPTPPARKSSISKTPTKSKVGQPSRKPPVVPPSGNPTQKEGISRSATYDKITSSVQLVNHPVIDVLFCEETDVDAAVEAVQDGSSDQEGEDIWVLQDGTSVTSLELLDSPLKSPSAASSCTSVNTTGGRSSRSNTGSVNTSERSMSHQETTFVADVKMNGTVNTDSLPETKATTNTREAIVPPFNYKPMQTSNFNHSDSCNSTADIEDTKPMTKSEMLIASQEQSYNQKKNTADNEQKANEVNKKKCIVTTV